MHCQTPRNMHSISILIRSALKYSSSIFDFRHAVLLTSRKINKHSFQTLQLYGKLGRRESRLVLCTNLIFVNKINIMGAGAVDREFFYIYIYRASQNSPKAPPDPPKVLPRASQTTLGCPGSYFQRKQWFYQAKHIFSMKNTCFNIQIITFYVKV